MGRQKNGVLASVRIEHISAYALAMPVSRVLGADISLTYARVPVIAQHGTCTLWNNKICIIDWQLLEFPLSFDWATYTAYFTRYIAMKHLLTWPIISNLTETTTNTHHSDMMTDTSARTQRIGRSKILCRIQENIINIECEASTRSMPMEIGIIVSRVRKVVHYITKHLTSLWRP